MLRNSTYVQRFILPSILLSTCVLSACVSPNEFEDIDRTCDVNQGKFDSPARNTYCSGNWSGKEADVRTSGLSFGEETFLRVEGRTLTAIDVKDASLEVRIFRKQFDGSYKQLEERSFSINLSNTNLSDLKPDSILSVSLLGLSDAMEEINVQSLSIALISQAPSDDSPKMTFLSLDETKDMMRQDQSGHELVFKERSFDASDQARDSDVPAEIVEDCGLSRENPQEGRIRFRSVASFLSQSPVGERKERQFTFVAADCAVFVYGYSDEFSRPMLISQLPVDALDVEIGRSFSTNDSEGELGSVQDLERFIYIASGFEGLRVNRLDRFEEKLHIDFLSAVARQEAMNQYMQDCDATNGDNCDQLERGSTDFDSNSNSGTGSAVAGSQGATDSFSMIDTSGLNKMANPVSDAAIHVTQVTASGSRVFYLNEQTDPDHPTNRQTYLVAAQVDSSGTLSEQRSVPVSDDDHMFEHVMWRLVRLGGESDSMFAVLRNTRSEGSDALQSKVKVYDAPQGSRPYAVMDVPIGRPIADIFEGSGKLWVVLSDTLQVYTFDVDGDPL